MKKLKKITGREPVILSTSYVSEKYVVESAKIGIQIN